MKKSNTYRKLDIYKKAFQFSLDVLSMVGSVSDQVDKTVTKGLTNAAQMSCIKIAEGWCRRDKEGALESHLDDASTALAEAKLWLLVGLEYNYIHKNDVSRLQRTINDIHNRMDAMKIKWVVAN